MEDLPALAGLVLGAYALGSVSFSLLFARWKGVDLRRAGSGNLGATNAGRVLGRRYGVAVYLLDALKGFLPAWVGLQLAPATPLAGALAGGAAVAGHVWPFHLRFRGGKGVATLSGAFLALDPAALGLAALLLAGAVAATRYMSVGSLALALGLPFFVWWRDPASALGERRPVLVLAAACGLLVLWTHRSNLRRLLEGRENRLGGGGRGGR